MAVKSLSRNVRDQSLGDCFRRAAARSFEYLLWKRSVVRRIPVGVLRRWFDLRSKVVPWTSDANPLQPIYVDPDAIEYYHSGGPRRFGHVVGGDWDTSRQPFDDHVVFRSLRDRYVDGCEWEETALFETYQAELTAGERTTVRGEADLKSYFENVDRLYESIRSRGYLTQPQLQTLGIHTETDPSKDNPHPVLDEVCVCIYRDGSIAKRSSGTHRLSIAKILDIDEIPVLVRIRHRKWQEIRDAVRAADAVEAIRRDVCEHIDHPDLLDVRPHGGR